MNDIYMGMLSCAIRSSVLAGKRILDVYETEFNIELKADSSPVTLADRFSHKIIFDLFTAEYPHIPILSEEGRAVSFEERTGWKRFWLVDPLDGTKDFIKKNGEFTVNIALIEKNRPVLGIVYIPCSDTMYLGIDGRGAFKLDRARGCIQKAGRTEKKIPELVLDRARPLPLTNDKPLSRFVILKSRSHSGEETESCIKRLLRHYKDSEVIAAGSATKLCILAEGSADIYPRLGPTMEWDTAAGHAILRNSGGDLLRTDNWNPLAYNKKDLRNPSFVAVGSSTEEMKNLLKSICNEGAES
jgi:3'(2'), 5'-bisphosphate nucleotidase